MTLVVNLESGVDIPLEIYVDRITNGVEGLVYSAPGGKGTLAFRTVAHARVDSEEGCDIDVFFGPGDQKKTHPSVEVPPDFVELMQADEKSIDEN